MGQVHARVPRHLHSPLPRLEVLKVDFGRLSLLDHVAVLVGSHWECVQMTWDYLYHLPFCLHSVVLAEHQSCLNDICHRLWFHLRPMWTLLSFPN